MSNPQNLIQILFYFFFAPSILIPYPANFCDCPKKVMSETYFFVLLILLTVVQVDPKIFQKLHSCLEFDGLYFLQSQITTMKQPSRLETAVTFIYSLMEIVDTRLRQLPLILEIAKFYEFIFIVYFCIRFTFLLPQYNAQGVLLPTIQNIDDIVILKRPFELMFILFFSLTSLFFCLLVVAKCRLLGNNYSEMVSWICAIMTLGFRAVWFWMIEQILFVFISASDSYPLVGYARFILILPLLLYIIYGQLILRNQYVYGVIHSLIPVAMAFNEKNIVLFALMCCMFFYINLINPIYPNKILCNSNMIFVLWGISQYFTNKIGLEELILVGIAFLCGLINHFYWGISLQLDQDFNRSINGMTQFLNKQKDSKIKEQDQIMVYESHLMLFVNSSQFSVEDQELLLKTVKTKDLSTIDKSTHFKLIQIFGKATKQLNNPFQLFIYDQKLNEGKDYYKSLLIIFDLYHSQSIWNFIAKYQLAKLLIKIQNWFIKFKNDNKSSIWNSITLQTFIIRFYDQLQKCLKKLSETWNAMNNQVVDFQKIWVSFSEALIIKESIQDCLEIIVNKYKRVEELVKYNSIMCSLNFPKFNRLPLETLTIETQPRASYIKICDNKIIAQSLEFKGLFRYQFEQLHLVEVNKLSPLKKSIFSDNLSLISNLKLLDQKYPIIDAFHYLTLVNMEIYLEPNILGKIQYIIFISPIYLKHQSYILYNFQTDQIEQASKGFCETYEIDVSLFHSFIKKPFMGKEVFEHINLNSSETKKQLTSDTGVQTEINIMLLNPLSDISPPQTVYLKTIMTIDQESSKKCIIRIQKQKPNNTQIQNILPQNNQNLSNFTKQLQRDKTYNQIIDKKANLKQSMKGSLDIVSIAFACLVVICGIISAIVFYYSSVWYDFLLNYIEGINTRSVALLDILFQEFSLMHLSNWPPPAFSADKISEMVSGLHEQLEKSMYIIQDKTLYSLVTINLPLVSRNIQSYGYSLKSTESGLDLFFNIVYSAPLIYTEKIVNIMIQKYDDVIQFANQKKFIEPYLALLHQFEIATVSIAGICLCLLPLIQIYRIVKIKVIESILNDTQELFSFADQLEIIKKIGMIRRSLTKVREPLEEQQFKINQTLRSQRSTSRLLTKKSINHGNLSIKDITKFRPLFQTICIMIVQVIVVGCYFSLILVNTLNISAEYPSIINYQQSLSQQQISLKTSFLTVYFDLINLKVNNVTPPNFEHPTSFIDNTVIQSFSLPKYFQEYTTKSWEKTNKNLCDFQFNYSDSEKCTQMIGGAMKSGASKTLQIYWDKINQLNLQSLDDVYDHPLFEELFFIEKYLLAFISNMRSDFVDLQKQYKQNKQLIFTIIILIGLVIILFSSFLGYYHQKDYRLKKSICQSLFNIFPEESFRRQDVRTFISKNNLIDRLSTL